MTAPGCHAVRITSLSWHKTRAAVYLDLLLYALGWTLQRWRLRWLAHWYGIRARSRRNLGRVWELYQLGNMNPRADLPCRPGQARPAVPRGGPDEGLRPGRTSLAAQPEPLAREVLLPVETPAFYHTDALPVLTQEAADEAWWSL